MDEEKKEVKFEELSDESRREFLNKAVVAAGAIAATGLLSAALSGSAEAQPGGITAIGAVANHPPERLNGSQFFYQKLDNGDSFFVRGPELTKILAREGVLSPNFANRPATVTLSLTYN
jgi:hypothetical protein